MRLDKLLFPLGEAFLYFPGLVERFNISVNASVLAGYLAWKTHEDEADGWRAVNTPEIQRATGLTIKEQATARKQLVEAGIIEEFYARLEHKIRVRFLAPNLENGKWPFAEVANAHLPNEQMAIRPIGESTQGVDQEREEEGESTICQADTKKTSRQFIKPTVEEVKAFCLELGVPASDGESFWLGKEGNGWRNGGAPVRDWKATLRNWKLQKFLPSQKVEKQRQLSLGGNPITAGYGNL